MIAAHTDLFVVLGIAFFCLGPLSRMYMTRRVHAVEGAHFPSNHVRSRYRELVKTHAAPGWPLPSEWLCVLLGIVIVLVTILAAPPATRAHFKVRNMHRLMR